MSLSEPEWVESPVDGMAEVPELKDGLSCNTGVVAPEQELVDWGAELLSEDRINGEYIYGKGDEQTIP